MRWHLSATARTLPPPPRDRERLLPRAIAEPHSPISEARRLNIQVAVISAIESLVWIPRNSQRPPPQQ